MWLVSMSCLVDGEQETRVSIEGRSLDLSDAVPEMALSEHAGMSNQGRGLLEHCIHVYLPLQKVLEMRLSQRPLHIDRSTSALFSWRSGVFSAIVVGFVELTFPNQIDQSIAPRLQRVIVVPNWAIGVPRYCSYVDFASHITSNRIAFHLISSTVSHRPEWDAHS